jgi:hypothetical protein
MPYSGGNDQRTAIFLSIKRKKGLKAAKAWYEKHRHENFDAPAKRQLRKTHGRRTQRQS